MVLYSVPRTSPRLQVTTVHHRTIELNPAVLSCLILYLYGRMDLLRLENGPFIVMFSCEDGTVGRYSFAFRGHARGGRRLAVAVDDTVSATEHDMPAYLRELQRRLPPEIADDVWLLTERGLECLADTVTGD